MQTHSTIIHEAISAGDAPRARAAWKTITAELVIPTSTATKPAATEEIERSLKKRIVVAGRTSGARAKPRAYAPPRYASCTWGFLSNSLAVSARTTVPVSIT